MIERRCQINDCFVEVIGRKITDKEYHFILERLPREVKLLAGQWGWSDTDVSNELIKWIREFEDHIILQ